MNEKVKEVKVKLENEFAEYQQTTPVLQEVTLKEAIKIAIKFEDNPVGQLENEIDSVLVDYEMEFLEAYLEDRVEALPEGDYLRSDE